MAVWGADEAATLAAMPLYRPEPVVPPSWSAWSLVTAVPRGIGEAAHQVVGSTADLAKAYRFFRDATPQQLRGGVPVEQYSSDFGDYVRDRGRELRPDPASASAAEQVLYGFARGAAKIVGSAVLAGPAGVVAAGLEEGMTQSDELRRQGVGVEPRTRAGVVQGAGLALAALPAFGATWGQTAALYVAGGPGGYVAQQAMTREILRTAGHERVAEQFDPLDPVGLAVASLLPAGFAWWGMRGQKLAAAAKSLPDLPRADAGAPAPDAAPFPSEPTAIARAIGLYDGARAAQEAPPQRVVPDGADVNVNSPSHIAAMTRYMRAHDVPVSEDGTVTLWHATTADAADKILAEGRFRGGATAPGGMTGLQLEPSAFFGSDRDWVANTWGSGLSELIEVRVPVQFLRHGAQNFREFYFEGGLTRQPDGTWAPDKLRSTFVDRLADKRFGDQHALYPDEVVDAARVAYQAEVRAASDPGAGGMRTADAHEAALSRAEDQIARGDAVSVADVAPELPDGATFADLAQKAARPQIDPPPAADVADDLRILAAGAGWAQRGGRILRDPSTAIDPSSPTAVYEGDVVGRTSWIPASEWFGRMRSDLGRAGLSDETQIRAAVEKAVNGEPLNAREARTVDWMRREVQDMRDAMWRMDDADELASDAFAEGLGARDAPDVELTARAAEIDADAVERAAMQYENDDTGFMAEMRRIIRGNEEPAAAGQGADARAGAGEGGAQARTTPAATAAQLDDFFARTKLHQPATAPDVDAVSPARVAEVAAQFPDLMVRADDMAAPMRLADFLEAAKAEADEFAADADLMKIAAECALTTGMG